MREAFATLDRRLDAARRAPIAVAVSGGGDSLMALKVTTAWARRAGRAVTALSVDHGLQAASRDWIEQAGSAAKRMGAGFHPLAWTGEKPATGLPAAARAARHRLIADAARELGATVVVFGHTADDIIEGDLMRAEGLRLGALREWSPSPAWPEGRGVFHVRPLLGLRRAAIRAALAADGETWIDDPANEDDRSPRARVRTRAAGAPTPPPPPPAEDDADLIALARSADIGDDGAIAFDRRRLRDAAVPVLHRMVSAALACAAGQDGPVRGPRLAALLTRLREDGDFTATLGGAKIRADARVLIVRDAGEARRGGLVPISVDPGRAGVWDGRFEIVAADRPLVARALAGRSKILPKPLQVRLRAFDPASRPALPLVEAEGLPATCPILAQPGCGRSDPLVRARFLAACGVISKEAAT